MIRMMTRNRLLIGGWIGLMLLTIFLSHLGSGQSSATNNNNRNNNNNNNRNNEDKNRDNDANSNNRNNNNRNSNNNNNNNNDDVNRNNVDPWIQEQQLRRDQIHQACLAYQEDQIMNEDQPKPLNMSQITRSRSILSYFYVDDVYKLIYCNVPKVSSTQWKKVLMVLSGSKYNSTEDIGYITAHFHNNLTSLSSRKYRPEDILYRLQHYSKVLSIRHPLQRLLSAYSDKFSVTSRLSKRYNNMYGKRWAKVVRNDTQRTGILQFDEMLEFLSRHRGPTAKFNGHWRPISDLCQPCAIQYDFVSNFTSQEHDSNQILNRMLKGTKKFDLRFPKASKSSTSDKLKKLLSTLDPKLVKDVQKKYSVDYDVFGYWPLN